MTFFLSCFFIFQFFPLWKSDEPDAPGRPTCLDWGPQSCDLGKKICHDLIHRRHHIYCVERQKFRRWYLMYKFDCSNRIPNSFEEVKHAYLWSCAYKCHFHQLLFKLCTLSFWRLLRSIMMTNYCWICSLMTIHFYFRMATSGKRWRRSHHTLRNR